MGVDARLASYTLMAPQRSNGTAPGPVAPLTSLQLAPSGYCTRGGGHAFSNRGRVSGGCTPARV